MNYPEETEWQPAKGASRMSMLLRKAAQSYFQPTTPEITYRLWLDRWKSWSQARELPCSVITIAAKPGPEASVLDSQIHILHSVPFSHSKYQATLTPTTEEAFSSQEFIQTWEVGVGRNNHLVREKWFCSFFIAMFKVKEPKKHQSLT